MTPEQTAAKLEKMPAMLRGIGAKLCAGPGTDREVVELGHDMKWLADFIDQRIATAKANGVAVVPPDRGPQPTGMFAKDWAGMPYLTERQVRRLIRPVIGFAMVFAMAGLFVVWLRGGLSFVDAILTGIVVAYGTGWTIILLARLIHFLGPSKSE